MSSQNIKTVLIAVNEVALELIRNAGGGVLGEVSGLAEEFFKNPAFRAKVEAALAAVKLVQAEAVSLGYMDALELAKVEIGYIPALLEALHNMPKLVAAPVPNAQLEAPCVDAESAPVAEPTA